MNRFILIPFLASAIIIAAVVGLSYVASEAIVKECPNGISHCLGKNIGSSAKQFKEGMKEGN